MLRPHSKISYRITSTDLDTIIADLVDLKAAGADGFVFGALTADRDIDVESCRKVIEQAGNSPVTFHRAFDMSSPAKQLVNVSTLEHCGFARLLTSGFAETAEIGLNALIEIQNHIRENALKIKLMPGCGVTVNNAEKILMSTGCKEFHASAKSKCIEVIPKLKMDTVAISKEIDNNAHSVTDTDIVRQLVSIGKTYLAKKQSDLS